MNKAKDLLALSILAFRNGQFDESAKLFTTAMQSEDLDSFVSEISPVSPTSKQVSPETSDSENTLCPSLASSDVDLEQLSEQIEARFRAECSLVDEEDEEVEAKADDEDEDDEDSEDSDEDSDDDDEESEEEESEDEDFESESSADVIVPAGDSDEGEPSQEATASGKIKLVSAIGPVKIK